MSPIAADNGEMWEDFVQCISCISCIRWFQSTIHALLKKRGMSRRRILATIWPGDLPGFVHAAQGNSHQGFFLPGQFCNLLRTERAFSIFQGLENLVPLAG